MESIMQLTCPKCRSAMASYERGGVVIDQCTQCRGVFLDHGELERIIDLTAGVVAPAAKPQWQGPPPDRSWRGAPPAHRDWARHDWDDDSDSRRRSGGQGYPRHSKRKSIIKELFDF